MKKSILLFVISLITFTAYADLNTDKAMSKIIRDTKTYISADARATAEEEAYNAAMEKLWVQIIDYFKTERPHETLPDVTYLSNISNRLMRMVSKIDDNRYRVILYVRKSDLKPVVGTIVKKAPEANAKADTTVTVANKPLDPTLSALSHLTTRDEIVEKLQSLGKSNHISGAAKFPLSHADNFYVVVIDGDAVIGILHYSDSCYKDINTSEPVDISRYSHCTGYWFTL